MKKIDTSLQDFLGTVTTDFNGLIGKIDQMKDNMSQLKKENNKAESELKTQQIMTNTMEGLLVGNQPALTQFKKPEDKIEAEDGTETTPGDKEGKWETIETLLNITTRWL